MFTETLKVQFQIQHHCDFGQALYVIGSLPQLGKWRVKSAFRLTWSEGHNWSGTIEFGPQEGGITFNYKYIVAQYERPESGYVLWEQGLNRCFRTEGSKKLFTTKDRWSHQLIKINVPNFFEEEDLETKALGIAGKLVRHRIFSKMQMFEEVKPVPGRLSWEYFEWIPLTVEEISFSIYFIDLTRNSVVKNRRVDRHYLLNPDNMVKNLFKTIKIQSNVIEVQEELRFKDFMYSRISDNIILGTCINESKEMTLLEAEGVGAILSLETPNDRARVHREEELLMMRKLFGDKKGSKTEKNIPDFTYPIHDSPYDVMDKAVKAAQFLKQLVETQKRVYVHCTFGVARSVHVVIAYLCLFEGMELADAMDKVREARLQARPNENICFEMFKTNHVSKISREFMKRIFFKKHLMKA